MKRFTIITVLSFFVLLLFTSLSVFAGKEEVKQEAVEEISTEGLDFIEDTFPPLYAGKPFAGQEITITTMSGWACWMPASERIPEFEEMTGIKVKQALKTYEELPSLTLIALTQKEGKYDVIGLQPYAKGPFPYLRPLTDRIKKVWGSIEEMEDWYFPPQKDYTYDGEYIGVAFHANNMILYYRKELFENSTERRKFKKKFGYELTPPKTINQLNDIATFFTRPPEMYGLTANWGPKMSLQAWLDYYMASTGNGWVDNNFRSTFKEDKNREIAIKISKWQQDSIYKYEFVNKDAITFLTGHVADFFMGGKAAMAYGWLSDYWPRMRDDPAVKERIGEVGAIEFPSWASDNKTHGAWASWWWMGIPKDSKHPDAAWEFIKWVLNEDQQIPMARDGGQLPPVKDLAYKTSVDPGGIN
ncbi:MAG: ABC transporter substrate-binding protein, partial [Chloroflexota bacterium]